MFIKNNASYDIMEERLNQSEITIDPLQHRS